MKFTLAASILLSAPVALAYAPNANFRQPIRQQVPTSLAYAAQDSTAANVIQTPVMDWTTTDDAATAALKKTLGLSEGAVQEEYSNWLMQYGKVADESRYATYKKNYLMQEEYNQRVGAAFTLNEYGDMTEQEFREMKANAITAVAPPAIEVEEEVEVVAEQPQVIEEDTIVLDEPLVEIEAETTKVEIIDETEIFVEKYKAIDDAEERAFEVLKDMNFVQPAPQHFSFSYVDGAPELKLESGSSYMDALHNPELSGLDGAGAMSGYLSSMPASESSTFEEGKSGNALGASTNYLEDICDMLEPFMDCGKAARTPISITSPAEDFIHQRAAQLKSLGDKAFKVLVELCSIGRCERP